jgi:hypothetical protein
MGVDPRYGHDPVVAGKDPRVPPGQVRTDRLDAVAADENVLAPWQRARALVSRDDDAALEQDGARMGIREEFLPEIVLDTAGYGERTRHGAACRQDSAATDQSSLHGDLRRGNAASGGRTVNFAVGVTDPPVAIREQRVADSVRALIVGVKWSMMARDLAISIAGASCRCILQVPSRNSHNAVNCRS